MFDDFEDEEYQLRYDYGYAYCKYCYRTHDNWDLSIDTTWECRKCGHFTSDEFMQLIESLDFHEYANLFPLIDGDEFDELVYDIQENGQIEPIWLYDGKILDGRNRYRACLELEIEPETKEYKGSDPLGFVLSLNLHRRHLTASQKAIIALDIMPALEEEAKEAQKEAGGWNGNQYEKVAVVEKIPQPPKTEPKSRDKAAALVGANPRYIQDAKKIQQEAPEIVADIRNGTVNIQDAKKIARLDDNEQLIAIEQIKSGVSSKKAIENARYVETGNMRDDEAQRMNDAKSGVAVVANQNNDKSLIKWAIENNVYVKIDRTSVWGNPFILEKDGDRDTVCKNFGVYLNLKPSLIKLLPSLKGKVLGCHCYPENCHGNIIAEVVNRGY